VEDLLRSTPAAATTTRIMWEQRKAALDAELNALEAALDTAASVALVFDGGPVIGSRDIRVDFSSKILDNYQTLVSAIFADQVVTKIGSKGPLPNSARSRLFITEIAHGSMGFVLEEAPVAQPEMLETSLKVAVDRASAVLRGLATGDIGEFEVTVAPLKPRIVRAVQTLAKTLVDYSAETRIVTNESLVIAHAAAQTLHERLSDVIVDERNEKLSGVLIGVLPEHLTFEFRVDEAAGTLYGSVTERMADHYSLHAAEILNRHGVGSFDVLKKIRAGKVLDEQWFLESFVPDTDKRTRLP
jgi:hypothetical protein